MNHKRLYVGDLAPHLSEQDLQLLFSQAGQIESITMPALASQRFAFIEMTTPEAAREAVRRFNGHEIEGYRLIVYTVPPKTRPRSNAV